MKGTGDQNLPARCRNQGPFVKDNSAAQGILLSKESLLVVRAEFAKAAEFQNGIVSHHIHTWDLEPKLLWNALM